MFDYVFPQELEDAIDAATAKFGPIECAKKFLFYFMTESGVHDGEVWDCLAELSESSYSDPQYIAKVEQLTDKYSEDAYSDERREPAEITLVVHISVMEGIYEAYSAAGGMGFGWWLVEHYLPYHVDCPDGCGLGETAGGG